MNFISTKDMTNETAPSGQVLVQYLSRTWGSFAVEFAIGYFDNPNSYTNPEDGVGWKVWFNSQPINVIAYCKLPEKIATPLTKMKQTDFLEKFGSFHPNLGSCGH